MKLQITANHDWRIQFAMYDFMHECLKIQYNH